MKIGQAIKEYRKHRQMSQAELALACGMTNAALSQIENGITTPSKTSLTKICNKLNVSEALLQLSCLEESDIPEEKRELYKMLYPTIKDMLQKLT